MNWTKVCKLDMMYADAGVCVQGNNGEQIAVFLEGASNELFAVSNHCPFAKANVLSRGLMAELSGKLTITSPIYKQHYDLKTGECLEDETVKIKTYPVREVEGVVEVAL
ncbi:nitrite reductase small subunit NirD [Marinicellulosiphila megalodicopiae]|uniref:nitrite reductase small subunit NirD n=1 Tax=Marinicellulosiphila megalodicopiae TaxID=2724896 RepID=UPI003BB088BA